MTTTAPAPPVAQPKTGFLSRDFLLVCTTHLAGYIGNWIIIPVLPLFLAAQGYNEGYIGLVLAAFNVSSFSTRPIFGGMVDKQRNRTGLMVATSVLGAGAFGYLLPGSWPIFLVRAAHGFGWGGLNTIGTAWIAMLAPVTRRAEAMGYFTMFQSFGTAIAPALGIWLLASYGPTVAFAAAGLFGFAALASASFTTDPRKNAPRTAPVAPQLPPPVVHEAPPVSRHWLARVVDPSVMGVTAILTLVQVTQPVVSSFMPLYFKSIGVGGVELFFVGQGIMSIFSRALLGQWGDRLGRSRAQALGFSVQMVGLVLIWQSRHLALLTLGGALYTLGIGISQPSLYALAADRSHPSRRGAAMATFTMGFQLGSGLGAVIWGTTIEYFGYSVMFGLTLIPMLGAIVMSQIEGRRKAVRTY